jgi:hypothetical protein
MAHCEIITAYLIKRCFYIGAWNNNFISLTQTATPHFIPYTERLKKCRRFWCLLRYLKEKSDRCLMFNTKYVNTNIIYIYICFCTMLCNIIIKHKPTKCRFFKISTLIFNFNVFNLFRPRELFFRKTVVCIIAVRYILHGWQEGQRKTVIYLTQVSWWYSQVLTSYPLNRISGRYKHTSLFGSLKADSHIPCRSHAVPLKI